ncbi:hypothetical protein GCM10027180_03730 [Microbulbifer echini]
MSTILPPAPKPKRKLPSISSGKECAPPDIPDNTEPTPIKVTNNANPEITLTLFTHRAPERVISNAEKVERKKNADPFDGDTEKKSKIRGYIGAL